MDAVNATTRRGGGAALRSRRSSSSMSQRLEEIVAQLMRPIHNLQQNFDIDLSLLEEYLTEMGVRRMSGAPEDFATIAMLVQQCAHIYGKKVDFYEQAVYDMVEKSTTAAARAQQDQDDSAAVEAEATSGRRRKRRHSGAFRDFGPIDLEPAPAISRQNEPVRQPPTLPKSYIEFERRPATERDARLTDYLGQEIGVAADYHVNWNLHNGMIVDDLDSSAAMNRDMVVPIVVAVLDEMRRLSPPTPGSDSGVEHHDLPCSPQPLTLLPTPPPEKPTRKRKQNDSEKHIKKKRCSLMDARVKAAERLWFSAGKVSIVDGLSRFEEEVLECRELRWHRGLMAAALGKLAASYSIETYRFNGFSSDRVVDKRGMAGFTPAEVREAGSRRALWLSCMSEAVPGVAACAAHDSDDDGFFEMSDASQLDTSGTQSSVQLPEDRSKTRGVVEDWQALIGPRLAEAEDQPLDVHSYSRLVLARLSPAGNTSFNSVASGVKQRDVCRYLLATLFLANTGNVEIIRPAAPLSTDGFDIRLLSHDQSLFSSTNPFD